jgi:hypothetical protein
MGVAPVRAVSFLGVPQTKVPDPLIFSAVYARCPFPIVVLDLITRIIRLTATFCEFQRERERERERRSS